MKVIKSVGIFPRHGDGCSLPPEFAGLVDQALSMGLRVIIPTSFYWDGPEVDRALCPARVGWLPDLVLSVGGDGTLLRAAAWTDNKVPVVGIHCGTLGFLTAYSRDEAPRCLEHALAGKLMAEPRLVLKVTFLRGTSRWEVPCINDVVVKHGASPRLLSLEVEVDAKGGGEYRRMVTAKADGLILSTPMGSTAYNLAAGGPIIDPSANVIAITPICPHSLTHRPVVVSGDSTIRITYNGPSEDAVLAVDGSPVEDLNPGSVITVFSQGQSFQIVPPPTNVFETLASKMGWSG